MTLRILIVALLVACNSDPRPAAKTKPAAPLPPPAAAASVDWSRPVPTSPPGGAREAGYVGAAECTPCHAKLSASYAHHGMARTGLRRLEDLDKAWLTTLFDGAAPVRIGDLSYRARRDGTHYAIEETRPDGQTWVVPITHALGSGDSGLSFYTRVGDRFYQIPLDWFPERKTWGIDPGFTKTNLRFFVHLDATCIACHTDPPKRSLTADRVFFEPTPAGVGCERCHGPGATHVATQKREDIINPAKLTALQQIEVCAQCHQDNGSVYLPGKDVFGYRPGDPLDGFRRNYVRDPAEPDRVSLLEHPDRMTRSACFLKSAGKLTCTTCHDPHTSSRGQTAAHWRDRCNSCHAKQGCTEKPAVRAKNGDDCVACHMRRGPTADIPSVDIVDHWIQTRPPPVRPGRAGPPDHIVTWAAHLGASEPTDEAAGTLAIAYDLAGRGSDADRTADAAIAAGTHVPEVYELAAANLGAHHRTADAIAMLARALAFAPDRWRTLHDYALTCLDGHQPAEAEHALDRMIALDPNDQRALEVKGMILVLEGRRAEARPILERAANAGPAGGAAHVALAALALAAHDREGARRELEAARNIEPRDPWVLDHLGVAHESLPPTRVSGWLPPDLRNP
ncbi:MAG: hypothetical protein JO257_34935 [Deltaproteobacteria bacterium]|nr:hypothetical protein [Deltaproteobacteria bacterium]